MPHVRPVLVSDYINQVTDLIHAHWLETERDFAPNGPAPAVDVYRALEQAGSILAFGAFDDAETLVGYAVAILSPHLHYGVLYAHHDLLYVTPAHRRGTLGLKLMRAIEGAAKDRGAQFSTWHAKPGSTLEAILTRSGYQLEESIFKKEF